VLSRLGVGHTQTNYSRPHQSGNSNMSTWSKLHERVVRCLLDQDDLDDEDDFKGHSYGIFAFRLLEAKPS